MRRRLRLAAEGGAATEEAAMTTKGRRDRSGGSETDEKLEGTWTVE
jgi:hypothetical protein